MREIAPHPIRKPSGKVEVSQAVLDRMGRSLTVFSLQRSLPSPEAAANADQRAEARRIVGDALRQTATEAGVVVWPTRVRATDGGSDYDGLFVVGTGDTEKINRARQKAAGVLEALRDQYREDPTLRRLAEHLPEVEILDQKVA